MEYKEVHSSVSRGFPINYPFPFHYCHGLLPKERSESLAIEKVEIENLLRNFLSNTPLVRWLNFSYVVIFDYHGKENWHVSDPHNLFQKSSNMINCLKYEYSVFFNSVKKHQKHLINWLATHVPFPIFGWSLTCHCIISLALN